MKNLLVASLLATTTCALTAEEKTHKHCIAPKGFYRSHNEENYNYKTGGIGVEYSYVQAKGLNIKLSGLSNLKNDNVLMEMENTLFFRAPLNEKNNLYPLLATKVSSHKMEKVDEKSTFIHKSTAYVGIGWELLLSPLFQVRIEGSLFRDLHNALMVQEKTHFWGKSYSNPTGGKAGLGLTLKWKEKIWAEVQTYYSHTFEKCYKEMGSEISFKWSF